MVFSRLFLASCVSLTVFTSTFIKAEKQTVTFKSETVSDVMAEGATPSYWLEQGIRGFLDYDDQTSKPLEFGITMPGSVLDNVLERGDDNYQENDGRLCDPENSERCAAGHRLFINIPESDVPIDNFPFKVLQIAWNPQGYMPTDDPGAFLDVRELLARPLFGIHTYAGVTIEDVKSLEAGNAPYVDRSSGVESTSLLLEDSLKRVRDLPPRRHRPPRYINLRASSAQVPWMGTHWGRETTTDQELYGLPGLIELFWGSFDNKFTFIEPVLFKEGLDRNRALCLAELPALETTVPPAQNTTSVVFPSECRAEQCYQIRLPDGLNEEGYYPQKYCVNYDAVEDQLKIFFMDFKILPSIASGSSATTAASIITLLGLLSSQLF